MRRVVVSGVGVVSPAGASVEALAQQLNAGNLGGTTESSTHFAVAEIPLQAIPEEKRSHWGRMDRLCRFFLAASYLAVSDAALEIGASEAERAGISFGTGLGCLLTDEEYYRRVVDSGVPAASPRLFAYTVSSAAAGEVSIALGIKGPNLTVHMGLAAGVGAVGYGMDLIQTGKADVVLAGGADVIGPPLVDALQQMRLLKSLAQARPFRDAIPGIAPAEAAVVLVLEEEGRARARGAPRRGRLESYAAGFEPTLTGPAPRAEGVLAALQCAFANGVCRPEECGLVVCSAHGTPLDRIEQEAFGSLFSAGTPPLLVAPKAAWGDALGASGVQGLALALGLVQEPSRLAPPPCFDLGGDSLPGFVGEARRGPASMAAVSALCYAGPFVALVLARDG